MLSYMNFLIQGYNLTPFVSLNVSLGKLVLANARFPMFPASPSQKNLDLPTNEVVFHSDPEEIVTIFVIRLLNRN